MNLQHLARQPGYERLIELPAYATPPEASEAGDGEADVEAATETTEAAESA